MATDLIPHSHGCVLPLFADDPEQLHDHATRNCFSQSIARSGYRLSSDTPQELRAVLVLSSAAVQRVFELQPKLLQIV